MYTLLVHSRYNNFDAVVVERSLNNTATEKMYIKRTMVIVYVIIFKQHNVCVYVCGCMCVLIRVDAGSSLAIQYASTSVTAILEDRFAVHTNLIKYTRTACPHILINFAFPEGTHTHTLSNNIILCTRRTIVREQILDRTDNINIYASSSSSVYIYIYSVPSVKYSCLGVLGIVYGSVLCRQIPKTRV